MPSLKDALLYTKSALSGEVSETLRAVQLLYQENPLKLKLVFYCDGTNLDNDGDDYIGMETDTFREFEDYLKIEMKTCPKPETFPLEGYYVYVKGEDLWGENKRPLFPDRSPYALLPDAFFQELPPYERLILATEQALLGKIPWNMRRVYTSVHETRKELHFWFFFDGECGPEEEAIARSVIREAKKQFSADYIVKESVVRFDFPKWIHDYHLGGGIVFGRNELYLYEELYLRSEEQAKNRNDSINYFGEEAVFHRFMGSITAFTVPHGIRAIKIGHGAKSAKDYLMIYRTKEPPLHEKFIKTALSRWIYFNNHELRVVKVDETTPIPEFGYNLFLQSTSAFSPPNQLLEKLRKNIDVIKNDEVFAITADVDEQEETLHVWIYCEKDPSEEKQKKFQTHFQTLSEGYRTRISFYHSGSSSMFFYPYGKPIYLSEKTATMDEYRKKRFPAPFFRMRLFQALLGRINPDLYAVKFGYNDAIKTIYLWFYYSAIPDDGAKALEQEIASHTCPWDGYKTVICGDFHDPKQELPSVGSLIFERMVKEE